MLNLIARFTASFRSTQAPVARATEPRERQRAEQALGGSLGGHSVRMGPKAAVTHFLRGIAEAGRRLFTRNVQVVPADPRAPLAMALAGSGLTVPVDSVSRDQFAKQLAEQPAPSLQALSAKLATAAKQLKREATAALGALRSLAPQKADSGADRVAAANASLAEVAALIASLPPGQELTADQLAIPAQLKDQAAPAAGSSQRLDRMLARQQERARSLQEVQHLAETAQSIVDAALRGRLAPLQAELSQRLADHLESADIEVGDENEASEDLQALQTMLVREAQAGVAKLGLIEPKDLHMSLVRQAWVDMQRGPVGELSSQVAWGLSSGRVAGEDNSLAALAKEAAGATSPPLSERQQLVQAMLKRLPEAVVRGMNAAPPLPGDPDRELISR